ncbi:gamma-butyrobetaine hydroxylase-like domain-containing protein [Marinagarivorans algicola]|uniref:gamma-butyrobetaine hydroxylase-like domain-containing protein n=1 Tax=Marinagarivorans algicola TaxID=1513270 RepID=UPI0006B6059B|nr:gamma-butyrobetaine hydroxylase-like domain-containing protein [Marinagarivorans algicola]
MTPTTINLRKKTQVLSLEFGDKHYELSAEFLRVHSPSAEVKGHGGQGGQLPAAKSHVKMIRIEAAGNYAIRIIFDDGHASGLFTWDYLYTLCNQEKLLWETYLINLNKANKTRDPETSVLVFKP